MLQITNPNLVTPQEAERFILALRDERVNMSHMRDSLCGGLAHLGAELYSSQVHNNKNKSYLIHPGTLLERDFAKHRRQSVLS